MKNKYGFRKRPENMKSTHPLAAVLLGTGMGILAVVLLTMAAVALKTAGVQMADTVTVPVIQALGLLTAFIAAYFLQGGVSVWLAVPSPILLWLAVYSVGIAMGGRGISPSGWLFLGMIPMTAALGWIWFAKGKKTS